MESISRVRPTPMSNNGRFVSIRVIPLHLHSLSSALETFDAQRQSFYIPNYFQAADALNAQEHSSTSTASLQESTRPAELSSTKAPAIDQPSVSSNGSPSTESDHHQFDYREPAPPQDQMDAQSSTIETARLSKDSVAEDNSRPSERMGQQTMQSLIHLLPSNLWSQLQNNRSNVDANQSHSMKPAFPDPVLLAEAAAQAGLPGPGPYPIPEHLWPYNPASLRTKPTTRSRG